MEDIPKRVRKPRERRELRKPSFFNPPALRVENDVGGPTSVYSGSVAGISQIVRIGINRQEGLRLDHGLDPIMCKKLGIAIGEVTIEKVE